ncbi:CDP-glycerol glycerophosphotransferase family protein [Microbacterium sp.]|uniref:CDP-glycerol glycerophosphotransferase family protein n=1 Tax=Microbacterium sp. TaxID=51671 RepID=UPI003F98E124
MGAVRDVKKAYRLLRRALRSRSAVQRVRRELAKQPPLPEHRFRIAVYFADGAVNMYQMRQWYRPLAELEKLWPVVVLARNAGGAEKLMEEAALPVAFVPTVRDVEAFISTQDIRIVLYVNQNTRNFQMFRYGRRWHVFINHGESDKMYMTTNQYKAYDYAFVAGQAARDRLSRTLWDYDIDRRTIEIGRPQADHYSGILPYTPDARIVVLYAPTWEGDRPSAHYGSIATHGEALITALLATGRHRVIYRPHPRSGVVDDEYGAAHKRIISAIAEANASDRTAQHVYDDGPELGWQLAAADVAIVDISAMVYDRLAVGKPLMITRPLDENAQIDTGGYLSDCEWLTADAARSIVAEVDRVRADEHAITKLRMWVQHYFGDTTPGVATAKFHTAIEQLMGLWDEWQQREIGAVVHDEDDDDEEEKDDESEIH